MAAILAFNSCYCRDVQLINQGRTTTDNLSFSRFVSGNKLDRDECTLPRVEKFHRFHVEMRQTESPTNFGTNGQPAKLDTNGQPVKLGANGKPVNLGANGQSVKLGSKGLPITMVPTSEVVNNKPILKFFYSHIGKELSLDHMNSSYVKQNLDYASTHNLELLLHLLDGYHGKGAKFRLANGRDVALVNKDGDILKHECLIPPYWSQVENKGLHKSPSGKWKLPVQKSLEDHLRPEEIELHLRTLGLA